MKNLKLALFSLAFSLLVFTSCTNNESIDQDQQQTEESESVTNALTQLRTQFNPDGNVIESDNPAGNIILDFCFDFVYPLTLSYNNDSTVTVNDLDGLIDVMVASNEDLFINGISFPFDVETFNDDTDTIEIETINNEAEFIQLLLSCSFDDDDDDEDCFEEYDPVCVEVIDPNGNTFIVTYPNECYAIEDGFTENDFVEDCEEDYYVGGIECYELNFPISIITGDGDEITVNSEEELATALYNANTFSFVFPLTVTLDDQTVVTIDDTDDLEDILEDCYDNYDDDDDDYDCDYDISDLENALLSNCDLYEIELENLNDDTEDIYNVNFNQNGELIVNGEITVTDLGSWNITETEDDNLVLTISGLQNFTLLNGSWNFECDDDDDDEEELSFYNDSYVIDIECDDDDDDADDDEDDDDDDDDDCDEEDIQEDLTECEWSITTSIDLDGTEGVFTFTNNTVTVTTDNETITGQWDLYSNPQSGEVYMSIYLPEPYDEIANLDWTVVACDDDMIELQSNNEFIVLEQECD
jgi:hypothetical protein